MSGFVCCVVTLAAGSCAGSMGELGNSDKVSTGAVGPRREEVAVLEN